MKSFFFGKKRSKIRVRIIHGHALYTGKYGISSNRISRAWILEQRASWIDPVSTRCFSTSICSEFFTSSSKANLFWKLSSLNVVRIARIILSKSSAILKCSLVDNRRTQRVFAGSKMRISRAKWPSVKLHLPCDTFSRNSWSIVIDAGRSHCPIGLWFQEAG